MNCQVPITDAEPSGLAQILHGTQAVEGVAANTPTALATQNSRKDVDDGIDVRRNIEAPPVVIVARVDDDGKFFSRDDAAKAVNELRASGATREYANHVALRA